MQAKLRIRARWEYMVFLTRISHRVRIPSRPGDAGRHLQLPAVFLGVHDGDGGHVDDFFHRGAALEHVDGF